MGSARILNVGSNSSSARYYCAWPCCHLPLGSAALRFNSIFGSIIKVLTFPVSIVTFGLFLFVVNAAMLSLTARWSDKLDVTGFWSALFASLIISTITTVFKAGKRKATL